MILIEGLSIIFDIMTRYPYVPFLCLGPYYRDMTWELLKHKSKFFCELIDKPSVIERISPNVSIYLHVSTVKP